MAKSREFSIEPGQPKRDVRSQHEKFVAIARVLGCDENEAAFDEKLKSIAKQKPKDEAPKSDKLS